MELVRIDLQNKDGIIGLAGDFHKGAANCHHGLIDEFVSRVYDTGMVWLNTGDNIEAIAPDDRRYKHSSVDKDLMTTSAQWRAVAESILPVAEQTGAIGIGNHEYKKLNDVDVGQEICDMLGVAYGGYSYVAEFYHNDKRLFSFHIVHGSKSLPRGAKDPEQREGNRKAALKRILESTGISNCILHAMGHTHQLVTVDPSIDKKTNIAVKDNSVKHIQRHETDQTLDYIAPERRWYCNVGSFLKLYTDPGTKSVGYAEMAMLEPADLGWTEVEYYDGKVINVKEVKGGV